MRKIDDIESLDNIFYSDKRHQVIKVELFDRSDSLYKIVLGNYLQVPKDITQYLLEASVTENAESGASANFTFVYNSNISPWSFCDNAIIKIQESDRRILNEIGKDIWFTTFLGVCIGQPGFNSFDRNESKKITVTAIDRSFFYNQKNLSSENFDKGEDFGDIGVEIATNDEYGMSLEREEVDFGKQNTIVNHEFFSIKETTFFEGLNNLFFILDKICQFSTEGKLVLRDTDINKTPSRIYQNFDCIKNIKWSNENVNAYNQIRIVGLANQITKQTYPRQIIADVSGSIGFYMKKYAKIIYYSDDRSHRGESPQIEEFKINGWLETIARGDAEVVINDDFSCNLKIKTPYNSWVFIAFFAGYIAFFIISAIDFLGLGKIAQLAAAIWLCAGLSVMQQMGVFDCSISVIPYQMLYKEIIGIATWSNFEDYEVRELEIKNHLVDTQTLADTIAKRELDREKTKEHPREIIMLNDPTLEPHDVIEIEDGSRYYICNISKRYTRQGINIMTIKANIVKSESDYA